MTNFSIIYTSEHTFALCMLNYNKPCAHIIFENGEHATSHLRFLHIESSKYDAIEIVARDEKIADLRDKVIAFLDMTHKATELNQENIPFSTEARAYINNAQDSLRHAAEELSQALKHSSWRLGPPKL